MKNHIINISKEGNMLYINIKCPFCNNEYIVKVKYTNEKEKYLNDEIDELIQNVFVDENKTIREHILSGLCKKCINKIFK